MFDELCLQIEKKSSPGWPHIWEGVTTNAQLLGNPALRKEARFRFIELLRLLRDGKPLPKPVVRLFVKPEPHKIEKIREGRLRLIWSIPFEYQLVHRLFFGPSLAAELANFRTIPTKGGMSWCHGGAHQIYSTLYDPMCDEIADCDKKGWDLSAAAWTIEMERDSRWRLCLNPNGAWKHAFWACYDSLLLVRVIFSDGTMCEQMSPGIVKSGSMITLSGNSRMQVILKVLFCIETLGYFDEEKHRIIAIGDDSLERMRGLNPKKYEEWLVHYGYTCKEISVGPLKTRTFCSHTFLYHRGVYVPVPVNWDKHRYALCYKEQGKLQFFGEQLFSLSFEYCFDDEKFGELRKAMLIRGDLSKCWSQELLQSFMSGQEAGAHPTQVVSQDFERTFLMALDGSLLRSSDQVRSTETPPAPRLVGVEENPGPVEWLLLLRALCALLMAASLDGFFGPVVKSSSFVYLEFVLLSFSVLLVVAGILQLEHRHFVSSYAVVVAILVVQLLHVEALDDSTRVSAYDCFELGTQSGTTKYPNSTSQKLFDIVTYPLQKGFEHTVHAIGKTLYPAQADKFLTAEERREREEVYRYQNHRKIAYEQSLRHSAVMPKGKSGGALKKAVKQEVKRELKGGKKGGKPRGRSSVVVSSVPGSKRGGMDYVAVGGSDYVGPLQFTGPAADGQQILEQPGQVIYKVQLQPFQMIPNSRLKKYGDLFEKWRFRKLSFEVRSTMSAMNAGNVLLVYEPNPLEATPAVTVGTAAADTKSLSRYEAHSNVMIASVATKLTKEGGKAPVVFNVKTKLQKGPFGGWFFNDALGDEPLQNTSQGQFFIMVQDPMSCLGSAATGAYKAGVPITWASLIIHYEIELSVANDENDIFLGDPPCAIGTKAMPIGTYYSNPLQLVDTSFQNFNDVGFAALTNMPGTPLDEIGFRFNMASVTPASTDHLHISYQINSPGNQYGIFLDVQSTVTSADMGTSESGWTASTTSSTANSVFVNGATTLSTATSGTNAVGIHSLLGTTTSGAVIQDVGPWVVGTGGSATVTAATRSFRFVAFMVPWKIFHNTSAMKGIADMAQTRPDLAKVMSKYLLQMRKQEPSQFGLLQRARAEAETKEEKKEKPVVLVLEEEDSPVSTRTLAEPKPAHWALSADRSRKAFSLKG